MGLAVDDEGHERSVEHHQSEHSESVVLLVLGLGVEFSPFGERCEYDLLDHHIGEEDTRET